MKTITLSIEKQYTDNRINNHFYDEGPLAIGHNALETEEMTSYIGYKHIDFKTGDIETKFDGVLHSGVPFVKKDSLIILTVTYKMEDDGVPCNEDTLYLHIEFWNSDNHTNQIADLPYKEGAKMLMEPHPYEVSILKLNGEEIEVEVKDEEKTTKHLVQLYLYAERDDQHSYATGNPNDPVDTAGPKIYLYLMRK